MTTKEEWKEIWLYILKSILKWIVGCTLIIKGFLLFWACLYFEQTDTQTTGITIAVCRNLLHIPYSKRNGYVSNSLKEGWHDLEPISQEEWISMECESPDCLDKRWVQGWLPSATEDDLNKLGRKGQKHLMCLSIGGFYGEGMPKNTMPKHCTNMFNCPSTSIYIHDYIFKYPKVLRNIIKIAEKPCYYLKDMPSEDENRELYRDIEQLRRELRCDKNQSPDDDKTYIVIHILDKEGFESGQLIIPRIDKIEGK